MNTLEALLHICIYMYKHTYSTYRDADLIHVRCLKRLDVLLYSHVDV